MLFEFIVTDITSKVSVFGVILVRIFRIQIDYR